MSGRIASVALALLLAGCVTAPVAGAPLLPTTAEARAQGAALAEACEGRDGRADAARPARIHGNTYHVGTCGIAAILVTSPTGHALIDGGTEEAAPHILANICALGFDPRDIRGIFFTHEHYVHMGSLAGAGPLVNPAACRDLAAMMADRLDTRLAQEAVPQ